MFFRGFLLLVLSFSSTCFAHSGRTDSNGCHSGSEPYHCHSDSSQNDSASSSSSDPTSIGLYHLALGTTLALSVNSVYSNFQHPVYVSLNSSGIGLGASFIDPNKAIYLNSKFYSDNSVISIGTMLPNMHNFDFYIGGGVFTDVKSFDAEEYQEDNSLNINLALSKSLSNIQVFVDFDSGPMALSLGLARKF